MITEIDFQILDWLQAHLRCGALDWLMPKITVLGSVGIFWILLSLVLIIMPKTRKLGVASIIALLLDVLLVNVVLKHIFMRTRPYDLRQVVLLVTAPTDTSFPSGHTAASFASACAFLFSSRFMPDTAPFSRRIGIPSVVLAAAIAFSRLYLYLHFPTDVLGGILCGILCGVLAAWITAKIAGKGCKFLQV